MYALYQNKYSNYLNLNLIRVKYADDRTILDNDFAIRLSDDYTLLKLSLYLWFELSFLYFYVLFLM